MTSNDYVAGFGASAGGAGAFVAAGVGVAAGAAAGAAPIGAALQPLVQPVVQVDVAQVLQVLQLVRGALQQRTFGQQRTLAGLQQQERASADAAIEQTMATAANKPTTRLISNSLAKNSDTQSQEHRPSAFQFPFMRFHFF